MVSHALQDPTSEPEARNTHTLTLEVILELTLEVILEHVLGIKTMTSLILDHAYLYLKINTKEKVMILFLVSLGIVTGLIMIN